MPDTKFKGKMLFVVCYYDKLEWLLEKLQEADAHAITVHYCEGVRKSNFVDMLGLGDNKRRVITAILEEKRVAPLFAELEPALQKAYTGVAFTVNIEAYAGAKSMMMIEAFLKNYLDVIEEEEEDIDELDASE